MVKSILVLLFACYCFTQAFAQTCSGTTTKTTSTGTFSISSYSNSASCAWIISPSNAVRITLSFSTFNTESGFDYIRVYAGSSASGTPLWSHSGSYVPSSQTFNYGTIFVQFTSDTSQTGTGFSASYTSLYVCSGLQTLTALSGTFTSNTQSVYTNGLSCQWLISVNSATSITISFFSFSTESNYDVVRVYRGSSTGGTLLGTYSGSSTPSPITVTGSSAYITFTTDSSSTYSGFTASYSTIPDSGSGDAVITGSPCGGSLATVTGTSGYFSDGSGILDYSNSLQCSWQIVAPSSVTSIRIRFTQFNTESCCDFVRIYQGTTAGTPLRTLSGSSLPSDITVNGYQALVRFTTDGSVVREGWTLTFSTCVGSTCTSFPTPPATFYFNIAWLYWIIPLCVVSFITFVSICRRCVQNGSCRGCCRGCRGCCRCHRPAKRPTVFVRNRPAPPVFTPTPAPTPAPPVANPAYAPPPSLQQPAKKAQPASKAGVEPVPVVDPMLADAITAYPYAQPAPPPTPALAYPDAYPAQPYGDPTMYPPPPAWDPMTAPPPAYYPPPAMPVQYPDAAQPQYPDVTQS